MRLKTGTTQRKIHTQNLVESSQHTWQIDLRHELTLAHGTIVLRPRKNLDLFVS
jgi:hypothetical protein